jgi:hypothetical protein
LKEYDHDTFPPQFCNRRFVPWTVHRSSAPACRGAGAAAPASTEDTPHDSYDFWNGFFDSVNPYSQNYGKEVRDARAQADQLPDPAAETQYLHYSTDTKRLRYATDIRQGGVAGPRRRRGREHRPVAIPPGNGDAKCSRLAASRGHHADPPVHEHHCSAGLDRHRIARADKAGKVSLDQLGFKTPQAQQGTSKILLTQGTGKLAVNVSKAPSNSVFVKALNIIMQGAKIAAPWSRCRPSACRRSAHFTEVLSYWEDRTRFVMAGNLTSAVATQQAHADPDREDRYIGLLSGDYLMVPQKHTDELAKELPNLDLVQGYLVRKDADPNLPLQTRAQNASRQSPTPPCASVCSRSTRQQEQLIEEQFHQQLSQEQFHDRLSQEQLYQRLRAEQFHQRQN